MTDAPSQHAPTLSDPPLRAADLDYELPEDRIARVPVTPRDAARLLVVSRSSDRVEHRRVRDMGEHLQPGDLLVLNDTAVAPARLVGRRAGSGGRVEGLLVEEAAGDRWRAMLKSNGRLRAGDLIELTDEHDEVTGDRLALEQRDGDAWMVNLAAREGTPQALMDRSGRTPLPPYILRARAHHGETIDDARDRAWYQTTYADAARRGSVAAPTAGLHFTRSLLARLESAGVRRASVTLHVGPGTFKPITAERLDEHVMHHEWYEVPAATLAALRAARQEGRRVIAVGTTSVRALESLPEPLPEGDAPWSGSTDLLIAPPYDLRLCDGVLTNFHLPRSTLLALVAALVELPRVHELYRIAIDEGYRFYSYGDAMLVLP